MEESQNISFLQFIDKFNEVKEATRNAISKVTLNGANVVTPVSSANASPITTRTANESPDNLLEPPGNSMILICSFQGDMQYCICTCIPIMHDLCGKDTTDNFVRKCSLVWINFL